MSYNCWQPGISCSLYNVNWVTQCLPYEVYPERLHNLLVLKWSYCVYKKEAEIGRMNFILVKQISAIGENQYKNLQKEYHSMAWENTTAFF